MAASCLLVGSPRGCIATPRTRRFCGYGCIGCGCVEAGGPLITSAGQSQQLGLNRVWRFRGEASLEGVVGVRWAERPSSLHSTLQLCVGLPLGAGRPVRFGLWQLRDVKHCADAQVKLSQNSPQLGYEVQLHDLAQQRVVSGCMRLELEVGGRNRKTKKNHHFSS